MPMFPPTRPIDVKMCSVVYFRPSENLSPRFSNGGCHENLDAARKSIAPLLSLGDKQKTLETQNAHGDYDAAMAKAAAAVTHVQSLSQEVGSGDEGLGLFGFGGWKRSRAGGIETNTRHRPGDMASEEAGEFDCCSR